MRVDYCDLCGVPLKGDNYHVLYFSNANDNIDKYETTQEYYAYLNRLQKEIKTICPTCKEIIDKIFELRLENLDKLTQELLGIYVLPSKQNPKERKPKNGKK